MTDAIELAIGDRVQITVGPWRGYFATVIGEPINGDALVRFDHSGGYKDLPVRDMVKVTE